MMKKGYMIIMVLWIFMLVSCTGKSIEERSFTYYDTTYGKFYLEVDSLLIDDLHDIITLTMKYTASQEHTFTLDTMDYGKAGMMHAELTYLDKNLYSSDDLPWITEGGSVTFEINEKVYRHVTFSMIPFDDTEIITAFPNGQYVLWLYVDESLSIETDIVIIIEIE